MPARYDNVRSVFEEAQRGLQHHKKLLTELKKLHDKTSQDEFQESFLFHLKHAMMVFNREPAVERVIEFAAKYATLKDHRIPSIQGVIHFVFKFMLKYYIVHCYVHGSNFRIPHHS